jgi:Fic family protein
LACFPFFLQQKNETMLLFPPSEIQIDQNKVDEVDAILKSTFRLIAFSRDHLADDLLNAYLDSTHDLQELMSIKNAQMEAQNDEEAELYLKNLNKTLLTVTDEIKSQHNFDSVTQLFQLFRSISPESHSNHPNGFRTTHVQIGRYICPEPQEVESLVHQLFDVMKEIEIPVIRAIYFHHELIRIHPFSDGNGRTTRVAKNWMLMYNLYPPIFIRDNQEKKQYLESLGKSFSKLEVKPFDWNEHLARFFDQELDRLLSNAKTVLLAVQELGHSRQIIKE